MTDRAIKERAAHAITHVENLPVLPLVVIRLMALDAESEAYFDEVIDIVGMEPNYAARLLAVANSASIRGQSEIKTLRDAVARLGSKAVANIIVNMSVVQVFIPRGNWEKGLWLHSIQVAHCTQALATHAHHAGLDPEHGYLAGLLHDIGRFLVFQVAPHELKQVDEAHWGSVAELVEVEKRLVGIDHATLGAMACAKWGLPSTIADIVREHHNPNIARVLPGDVGQVGELVRAADAIMSGSMKEDLPSFGTLSREAAMKAVNRALPTWYAPATDQFVAHLMAVEQRARQEATALGL